MDQNDVGNMGAFYDRHYSMDELQRLTELNNQDTVMDAMTAGGADLSGMSAGGGGPTFEQMMQRTKDVNRRRSSFHTPNHYRPNRSSVHEADPRRSSMLEFGSSNGSDLDGFQFDPGAPPPPSNGMQRSGSLAQRRMDSQRARRQQSDDGLSLSTSFPNMTPTYGSMTSSSPYQNIHSADAAMGFDMSSNYVTSNMLMGLDFSSGSLDGSTNGGITPRNTYSRNNFTTGVHSPPVQQSLPNHMNGQMHDPGGGTPQQSMNPQNLMEKGSDIQGPDQIQNLQSRVNQQPISVPTMQMQRESASDVNPISSAPPAPNLDVSDGNGVPYQGPKNSQQQIIPQYKNAYSSSGFDMLGVLMRVATRPNPAINIGAVDMSCAFVVCDVTMHDIPIVYCSDVFERLTAYTRHEILGRNCRFLQAPDGKIKAGIKRKYVDDQSVYRIKKMITQRQETQISVINYRKGGQPFMNLLTMIPITWDSDEIKYYVGFQVDLVEQPSSVTNKNPGEFMER